MTGLIAVLTLAGPLIGTSSAWLHVRHCTYDRSAGAYYDTKSGAYVQYSLNTRGAEHDEGVWQSAGKLADGTPYEVHTSDDAPAFVRRSLARTFGVSIDELAALKVGPLPPHGSKLLDVRFQREGYVWLFRIAHCSPEQAARMRALLMDQGLKLQVPGPAMGEGTCPAKAESVETFEAMAEKPLEDVIRKAGQPSSSWQYECGGIALAYPLSVKESRRGYEAIFARSSTGARAQWIEGPYGKRP